MKILADGIDLSDQDVLILKHQILDIEKWVRDALDGRIHHARGQLIKEGMDILKADPGVSMIPKDEEELINQVCSRSDYKNREQLEQEYEAKRQAALEIV